MLIGRLFTKKPRLPRLAFVASILLPLVTARLFLPPMSATWHEEAQAKTMKFVREIMVVAMIAFVSVGAFGQSGRGGDKRPPKEKAKVIDKKDNRPPSNSNRPKPRDDRKKPFFGED